MAFQATYYIKAGEWSYDEFTQAIKSISTAQSVTGIVYSKLSLNNNIITGFRESTMVSFNISLERLYEAYSNLSVFNTKSLKPYVDRLQSPSLAILIACGAIIKANKEQTALINENRIKVSKSSHEHNDASPKLKKYLVISLIVTAIILIGNYFSDSAVSNGRLTEISHIKALATLKSHMANPSSYVGERWEDALWDTTSTNRRYILKHNFIQTNNQGERVRSIAFIYFDIEGNPTGIEIIE